MTSRIVTLLFVGLLTALGRAAQSQTATSPAPSVEQVAAIYPEIDALYRDLHQHPELSMHEQQTGAKLAERWHGTLVLIGQPAEETGEGATAMLKDGLFTRFPKPSCALAIHDDPTLPAGQVGFTTGYTMASSDSVDVTIYGRGGHGAQPQDTVDPIVIGARTVMALQTIVSREINPRDPLL